MAIFQRTYRAYEGDITPAHHRPWVMFRYALVDVFSSRAFSVFFAFCFIPPLVLMCFIYMRFNLELLIQFAVDLEDLIPVNADFFATWMQTPQLVASFVLILVIGPSLVSPDLRNNALPLYLSRPVSQTSYILGKLSVLVLLASLITWVPALLLIGFQAYMADADWLTGNAHLPAAALVTSLSWIVCLSMMSLAVSAWVKWKVISRLLFFGLFFIGKVLGDVIRNLFGGWSGSVVNLADTAKAMVLHLYQIPEPQIMPFSAVVVVFLSVFLLATFLLTRRIRALDIVS